MAKNKKTAKYQEGDWVAVPLNEGGYALGVIARMAAGRGAKSILGYFFGRRFDSLPAMEDTKGFTASQAIHVCIFGDLGLHEGKWIVIGPSMSWERSAWPMPIFGRMQLISGIGFQVRYADDNPDKVLSERKCDPSEIAGLPQDGLSGSGAVESVLSFKLGKAGDGKPV